MLFLPSFLMLCLAAAAPGKRVVAVRPAELAAQAKRLTAPQLLEKVRALDRDLELDALVPFAQELVGRSDASLDQKREGWLRLGAAFVILGDPVAAELPFTQLLRVMPGFVLPDSAEPKVALVFKKVQGEERELARALEVARRAARTEAIEISGEAPQAPRGGLPLHFEYRVLDPAGDVRAVRVAYRRPEDPAFSSLALVEGPKGTWSGSVPAEVSVNESGLRLAYYVETADAEGPLRTLGTANAPRPLDVTAGQLEKPWRPPLPRWLFFTSAALTVASGAVGGTLFFTYRSLQVDYDRYVASDSVSYAVVVQKRADGDAAAFRSNVGLITAASLLLVTGVIAILVDWAG